MNAFFRVPGFSFFRTFPVKNRNLPGFSGFYHRTRRVRHKGTNNTVVIRILNIRNFLILKQKVKLEKETKYFARQNDQPIFFFFNLKINFPKIKSQIISIIHVAIVIALFINPEIIPKLYLTSWNTWNTKG